MRKKTLFGILLAVMILLQATAVPAAAEVYLDQTTPEEWEGRETLTLTAFQQYGNDTALLEVGGKSMLIDGGFKGARFKMEEVLKELGYDGRVDILYNTHPHDDHVGAVQYMVRMGFQADSFWSTFPEDYTSRENNDQQLIVKTLREHGIPYRQLANGETVEFGGARITFYYYPDGKSPNALSSMMHLTFGTATLLMTADVERISMQYFHEQLGPELLKADVMKFPHHGINRALPEFLADVQPAFVYITNYSRGTPAASEQLRVKGIPFKHTSPGRLIMKTDGTDWYVYQLVGTY